MKRSKVAFETPVIIITGLIQLVMVLLGSPAYSANVVPGPSVFLFN